MKWKYESDGEINQKTHYLCAENLEGKTLKETFLRIDCPSKKEALRLLPKLNNDTARPCGGRGEWEELEANPFSLEKITKALIKEPETIINLTNTDLRNTLKNYKVWVVYGRHGEPIGISGKMDK